MKTPTCTFQQTLAKTKQICFCMYVHVLCWVMERDLLSLSDPTVPPPPEELAPHASFSLHAFLSAWMGDSGLASSIFEKCCGGGVLLNIKLHIHTVR